MKGKGKGQFRELFSREKLYSLGAVTIKCITIGVTTVYRFIFPGIYRLFHFRNASEQSAEIRHSGWRVEGAGFWCGSARLGRVYNVTEPVELESFQFALKQC